MNKVILSGGGNESAKLIETYPSALIVTIDYGQRAWRQELEATKRLAGNRDVITLKASGVYNDTRAVLSNTLIEIPNRNMMLVSMVAAWAISHLEGDVEILLGVHKTIKEEDLMWDCSEDWVKAMNKVLPHNVQLVAPFMHSLKRDILCSSRLRSLTYSCVRGVEGEGCGECEKCRVRQKYLH